MGAPTTRCKFQCQTVENGVTQAKVVLTAMYPNADDDYKHSAEDHAFFNATPSGRVELVIQNARGAELFQPGDFYYLDFTKAPSGEPLGAAAS